MNARTILFAVLFCVFGTIAEAQRPDIPGGIVYSNGKDAIYMDFATGKEFNLTSDDNRIVFNPPFVISDNGKKLLWVQASRFCMKDLPVGPPQTVRALIMKPTKDGGASGIEGIYEDIIWQGEVKNLSISPDGVRFAYDASFAAPGWVVLDQGDPAAAQKMMAAGLYANFGSSNVTSNDLRFLALSLWTKRNDFFNGIAYISTKFNAYNPNLGGNNPLLPVFGNTIKWPPNTLFKASFQDVFEGQNPPPGLIQMALGHGLMGSWQRGGETRGGQSPAPQTVHLSKCVKKNAHFLTFQKHQAWEEGWKKAAFIYQIGNQWGPIEIQTLDGVAQSEIDYIILGKSPHFLPSQVPEKYKGKNARWLEIQATFPEVVGLAWKPDGSLSVFTKQGDVFLIFGEEIRKAFAASTAKLAKSGTTVKVVVENNFFRPVPKIVAQGIRGTCFTWVSNHYLLYLDADKNVCLWNGGRNEKVAGPINHFSYCSVSPFSKLTNLGVFAEEKKVNGFPAPISGLATTPEGGAVIGNTGISPQDSIISFGQIQAIWIHRFRGDSVRIPLKIKNKFFDLGPLKFTLIEDGSKLDDIKDPSQYDYFSGQERKVNVDDNPAMLQRQIRQLNSGQTPTGNLQSHLEVKVMDDVFVPLGAIIILNHNNSYLALKPISLGLKYKTMEEVPEWAKHKNSWGDHIAKGQLPPIYSSMDYEWKYWPSAPAPKSVDPIDPKKDERWNISTAPFGQNFEIGGIKFTWQKMSASDKKDQTAKFWISFAIGESDLHQKIEHASDWNNTYVSDPTKYEFRQRMRREDMALYLRHNRIDWQWGDHYIYILKIGEKYIAIEPVEERQGWIKYKWQYWPPQKATEPEKRPDSQCHKP